MRVGDRGYRGWGYEGNVALFNDFHILVKGSAYVWEVFLLFVLPISNSHHK